MPERRPPLWLWPNLLSLDAPLVAVSWLYMFARAWRVDYHPWPAYLALGLSVWVIYAGDRLLDVRLKGSDDLSLGSRHRFHARYRNLFLAGMVGALVALVAMLIFALPGAVFGYLITALILVAGFFTLVVLVPSSREIPYLRNLVAGMTFGFGTALAAHAYLPGEGVGEMLRSREMLSFGMLCVLNISAIHLWEHSRRSDDPEIKAEDELSLTLPLTLLGAVALVFAYLDNRSMFGGPAAGEDSPTRPFFYAILVSAALLQVINRTRDRFSLDALRSLADLAMILPLPIFLSLTDR